LTGHNDAKLVAFEVRDSYAGPSATMAPGQVPGMNYILQSHVESHAASAMRQLGLSDATPPAAGVRPKANNIIVDDNLIAVLVGRIATDP